MVPTRGYAYDGTKPIVIKANYTDASGIRIKDCYLKLDGKDVTNDATITATSLVYEPKKPIEFGDHTLTIRLKDGLGKKKGMKWVGSILAVLFCIFTMLASFGIGSMGQVNKIVANVVSAFDIPALSSIQVMEGISLYNVIIGVLIMALTALIVLGGLKRIANVAEKIVPFMVVLFVAGSLIIIGINYASIGAAFKAIFVNAFSPVAAVGGGIGVIVSKVITQGFKRGVFSNEAGLGSSVMVHSNSNVKSP